MLGACFLGLRFQSCVRLNPKKNTISTACLSGNVVASQHPDSVIPYRTRAKQLPAPTLNGLPGGSERHHHAERDRKSGDGSSYQKRVGFCKVHLAPDSNVHSPVVVGNWVLAHFPVIPFGSFSMTRVPLWCHRKGGFPHPWIVQTLKKVAALLILCLVFGPGFDCDLDGDGKEVLRAKLKLDPFGVKRFLRSGL